MNRIATSAWQGCHILEASVPKPVRASSGAPSGTWSRYPFEEWYECLRASGVTLVEDRLSVTSPRLGAWRTDPRSKIRWRALHT